MNEGQKPDVTVSIEPEAAKRFLGEKELEFHNNWSGGYFFAKLKPEKFLFASPGITSAHLGIADIESGDRSEILILVPSVISRGRPIPRARDKEDGVFIFDFTRVVSAVPLVLAGSIPKEDLPSARAVFDRRNRYDYRKPEMKMAEQAGTGQPATRPESKSEGGDEPQPEAEGSSR